MFMLVAEMEEPLDRALAFVRAIDLMGLGLSGIADDHATAVIAIAQTLTDEITAAKNIWRQLMAASTRKYAGKLRGS